MARKRKCIAGVRSGMLTAIREDPLSTKYNKWICKCDCGSEKSVALSKITCGKTVSCGCRIGRPVDLTGKRFWCLTVLKLVSRGHGKETKWLCRCECGGTSIVNSSNLSRGNSKTCGCSRKRHPESDGLMKQYGRVMSQAEKAGREFNISTRDFYKKIKSKCWYCGSEPTGRIEVFPGVYFHYNGLDRTDNNKGYTKENTVPCCRRCNFAKGVMPMNDFVYMVVDIYNHLNLDSVNM